MNAGDDGLVGERTLLFGAAWCADCRRAKAWLRRHEVPFVEFDTGADPAVRARAAEIAGGRSEIPVLVTPEGAVLVEPTSVELSAALRRHGQRQRGQARCR